MIDVPVVQCEFLVPIRRDAERSDAELHSTEEWEWLDEELFIRFDGATVAPGLYTGF